MHEDLLKRVSELEQQVRWLLTRQAVSDGRSLEPMYTIAEVADLLRCSLKTVKRHLIQHNAPRRYLIRGVSRIKIRMLYESEVRLLLKSRSVPGSDWESKMGQTSGTADAKEQRRIA